MQQHAYFLAKIGADTAENEQHFAEILPTDALWRRAEAWRSPLRYRPVPKESGIALDHGLIAMVTLVGRRSHEIAALVGRLLWEAHPNNAKKSKIRRKVHKSKNVASVWKTKPRSEKVKKYMSYFSISAFMITWLLSQEKRKTLYLLWSLIFEFQDDHLLNWECITDVRKMDEHQSKW